MDESTTETTSGKVIRRRTWRAIVPFAVIIIAAGVLAHFAQPPAIGTPPDVSFEGVPKSLGAWRYTHDVSLSENEKKYLVPDAVLYRTYVDKSMRPVTVLTVYRLAERREFFHIPEACYPAGGLTILDRKPTTVSGKTSSFSAIEIMAEGGDQRFLTLYWFASGSRVTGSATSQQLQMWLDRMFRNNEGWAFVRVITPVTSNEEEDEKALKDFATKVSPEIMKAIREAAQK